MSIQCIKCCKTFTRCAYMMHVSRSSCAKTEATPSTFKEDERERSPEVLQKDDINLIVVTLDQNENIAGNEDYNISENNITIEELSSIEATETIDKNIENNTIKADALDILPVDMQEVEMTTIDEEDKRERSPEVLQKDDINFIIVTLDQNENVAGNEDYSISENNITIEELSTIEATETIDKNIIVDDTINAEALDILPDDMPEVEMTNFDEEDKRERSPEVLQKDDINFIIVTLDQNENVAGNEDYSISENNITIEELSTIEATETIDKNIIVDDTINAEALDILPDDMPEVEMTNFDEEDKRERSPEVLQKDDINFIIVTLDQNENVAGNEDYSISENNITIEELSTIEATETIDKNIIVDDTINAEALDILPDNIPETEITNINEVINLNKGFTKNGIPRKRSAPQPSETKKSKLTRQKEKHPLRAACDEDICKRKCFEKISDERRKVIHEQFWSLGDRERHLFVLGAVTRQHVSRKTVWNAGNSRRSMTFFYSLINGEGEHKKVCKTFFLSTLGYNKNNDSAIFNILNQPLDTISPKIDKRGRHLAVNKIERDAVVEHIMKFQPCVHHYRREHAPNRLYLPTDVNVTIMHDDYIKSHPNSPCSYELYRLAVSKLNISFTKLGHEECGKCEMFQLHNEAHAKNPEDTCEECQVYLNHRSKFEEARNNYQASVNDLPKEALACEKTVVYSMDLQKVIMLPQMDEFKECLFTRRLVAFNESFVPVGKCQTEIQPIACIWHEAVSGRKKQDICSAIHKFLTKNRDAEKIILWMDNCAAQNKNWSLFSYIVCIINSNKIAAINIEFNYLEPGHTFMSADTFHHQVAKQLKLKKKIYDFNDFSEAVQNSNSKKVTVENMEPADFFLDFDFSSVHKINKSRPRPYLCDIVQVCFERGSLALKYRKSFSGEQIFLDFLKKQYSKNQHIPLPDRRTAPRGISQEKKDDIISNLLPLMPLSRRDFWLNIQTSDAPDMTTNFDD